MKANARFDTTRTNLCPSLRWKRQFFEAQRAASVPNSNEGLFWCVHTQTCIGPDGEVAEPGNCCSATRTCHGKNGCE